MVRLKGDFARATYNNLTAFQFHYGSVKSDKMQCVDPKTKKFQFHYGSVKSRIEYIDGIIPNEFQFHYGSVKRILIRF